MLTTALIIFAVAYLLVGLALTAFCVHMSYHEAAIGKAQSDDAKARGVLETRWGLLWLALLVALWPLALVLSVLTNRDPNGSGNASEQAAGGNTVASARNARQVN